jgi:predicted GNAT family N-acyltransferase
LQCHDDLPDGTKVFSIVDVLVANSFTLCGLEEKLIDRAVREAQTAGYTHAEAYPSESLCGEAFDVLVAYYESIGFVTVRDLTNEDDGRSFMMRKAL